jgi:hypothetical protein
VGKREKSLTFVKRPYRLADVSSRRTNVTETAPPPYKLHVWLKTHCYPGTDKRVGYRDVAHRAKMSHVTLYGFGNGYQPSPEQRAAILEALRQIGFKVKERDVFGVVE